MRVLSEKDQIKHLKNENDFSHESNKSRRIDSEESNDEETDSKGRDYEIFKKYKKNLFTTRDFEGHIPIRRKIKPPEVWHSESESQSEESESDTEVDSMFYRPPSSKERPTHKRKRIVDRNLHSFSDQQRRKSRNKQQKKHQGRPELRRNSNATTSRRTTSTNSSANDSKKLRTSAAASSTKTTATIGSEYAKRTRDEDVETTIPTTTAEYNSHKRRKIKHYSPSAFIGDE